MPSGHRRGAPAPARTVPDFLARMHGPPRDRGGNRRHAPEAPADAPELDCLRDYLAPDLLQAAAERGRLIGVGADRVLIHWGVLDEGSYLFHLAAHTGIGIDTPADTLRSDIPVRDEHLPRIAQHGLLPLRRDGEYLLGIAPRNLTAQRLCRVAMESPAAIQRFRLVPPAQLNQVLLTHAYASLAYAASEGLNQRFPGLTAAPLAQGFHRPWRFRVRHACVVAAVAGLFTLPQLAVVHAVSGRGSTYRHRFRTGNCRSTPSSRRSIARPIQSGSCCKPSQHWTIPRKSSTSFWWSSPTIMKPAPPSRDGGHRRRSRYWWRPPPCRGPSRRL